MIVDNFLYMCANLYFVKSVIIKEFRSNFVIVHSSEIYKLKKFKRVCDLNRNALFSTVILVA